MLWCVIIHCVKILNIPVVVWSYLVLLYTVLGCGVVIVGMWIEGLMIVDPWTVDFCCRPQIDKKWSIYTPFTKTGVIQEWLKIITVMPPHFNLNFLLPSFPTIHTFTCLLPKSFLFFLHTERMRIGQTNNIQKAKLLFLFLRARICQYNSFTDSFTQRLFRSSKLSVFSQGKHCYCKVRVKVLRKMHIRGTDSTQQQPEF